MRVNLISNKTTNTGLSQDVHLLRGVWTLLDESIDFSAVHHNQPQCPEADVNIFFEVLNPCLFVYAGINIWIPNQEWAYKSWIPYFGQLNQIWCKTRYAFNIFKEFNPNTRYIGWSSVSKGIGKKDYNKAIVLTGKNIFRHPQIIVDTYNHVDEASLEKLPELHVVYDGERMNVNIPIKLAEKIHTYPVPLNDDEYTALLKECGLAICISAAEGFGHAVNEAASTGSILMLGDIAPLQELGYGALWVPKKNENPWDRMDTMASFAGPKCLVELDNYLQLSEDQREKISADNADTYLTNHNAWVDRMKTVLGDLFVPTYSLEETATPEDQLPCVTIVTPTRDRVKFMEVCAGCVDTQTYPAEKLEWIVLDDGKDTCEDIIKHIPFAKHVLCTPGISVAEKRNMGAHLASHPIIVSFDDDDIYPPNSILFRVSMLLRGKGAVYCSVLPSYDIKNFISFMNIPPLHLPAAERVSEATLAFTKEFWQEKGFDNACRMAEGDTFIRGREDKCREISPQEVIVSLVHPRTTSARRAPADMKPNGCHFGFTDDLFQMLTKIAV
jgi:hypothetical protein